ncbi:hypothetical protein BG842_01965 [Haladaptatus sp. W1]|uniref:hypothetical protein n=1 Tax=Haladaptatus sp. W1 TaxID=1897478 RepID=UPI0008498315|nr:hypothetical protein [Haladaptatus sp. W1]ODR81095.1 hypothetical protein BG842_01965 [Haladaptatus sp. W1]
MSENATDEESETEPESAERSGSGLKTLVLLGISFIAGYLVGKSRNESSLGEELGEFSGSESGPMEIEIHDTDVGTTTESDDEEEEAEDSAESEEADGEDEDEEADDKTESDEEEEEE